MHDLKCPLLTLLVSYVRENIHPYDFRTIGNEFSESCFIAYDGQTEAVEKITNIEACCILTYFYTFQQYK